VTPFAVTDDTVWALGGTARLIDLVRIDLDAGGLPGVGLGVAVARQPQWGTVLPSYDGANNVWLLYEVGRLQQVAVG
jgi:hypothetical protein